MSASPTRTRLYLASQLILLAVSLTLAALASRSSDWHPLILVAVLPPMALLGDRLMIRVRNQILTASFLALVLEMALLGPLPAAATGAAVAAIGAVRRKRPLPSIVNNAAVYAAFPVVGSLTVRMIFGDVHSPHNLAAIRSLDFGLVVFGVFVITNSLNFLLVAIHFRVLERKSITAQVREGLVPFLPAQLATGAFAALLAVAYTNFGYVVLLGLLLLFAIFQYLAAALLRSEDRADQLEARTIRLASLQLGVLVTLVETLALRDRATARHSAAVAHLARALAVEAECDANDQDLVHSAGLLHDIGKFALPDHVLHATELSEADAAIIRRHPQEGATIVGRLDGYGPVADAILYHHERVDGLGYPAGLIGKEIPQSSRILAVCNTYDRLTSRDSYRSPMTPRDAFVELRRASGTQLDGELVERFIAMLEREGPVTSAYGDVADFEAELEFEKRARMFALASTSR